MKCSFTTALYAQASNAFPVNSGPLSTTSVSGSVLLGFISLSAEDSLSNWLEIRGRSSASTSRSGTPSYHGKRKDLERKMADQIRQELDHARIETTLKHYARDERDTFSNNNDGTETAPRSKAVK